MGHQAIWSGSPVDKYITDINVVYYYLLAYYRTSQYFRLSIPVCLSLTVGGRIWLKKIITMHATGSSIQYTLIFKTNGFHFRREYGWVENL